MEVLRAPFPWMGGKSRAAPIIWRGFGPDVVNYVEPFAGSLAALLGRPNGPRAGWLLASLERDFVIRRLTEAGAAGEGSA